MNTLKVLSRYAFIFMALLVTACDKDDDSSGGGDDPAASGDEFVTAKVDGANFAAAQDPAVIVGAVIDSGVLNVQGGATAETLSELQVLVMTALEPTPQETMLPIRT